MTEKDVVITYETLFELLRIEKNREDLQKLDDSFFDDVRSYLNDKQSAFESQESQSVLFASDDKEKARLEIENIKKILKQLYDLREKKIIRTSVNKARTGVTLVNTANMLPSERLLFDSVSMVLFEFRKNILFKLACGEVPDVGSLPDSLVSKLNCDLVNGAYGMGGEDVPEGMQELIPAGADQDDESDGMHFQTAEEPKELKTSQKSTEISADVKKVRILASIGEIVGPDLQIYGPYDEGAVTDLPDDLARVLLEKKQAEEVMH